jgi:hypothetical protein
LKFEIKIDKNCKKRINHKVMKQRKKKLTGAVHGAVEN